MMQAMAQPSEFQKWVLDELAKRPHGTRAALADYVGITRDKLTRSLNWEPGKETRKTSHEEAELIKEFFEKNPVEPVKPDGTTLVDTLIAMAPTLTDTEARALIEIIRALRRVGTSPDA